MANEIELKLALAPQGMQTLKQSWLPRQNVEGQEHQLLGNIYFDTPKLALNQRKVALRLRENKGQFIQTLKTKGQSVGGLHQRGEWEWEVAEPRLYPELLAGTAFPAEVPVAELVPIFRTDFERTAVLLRRGDSLIELALDEGWVISGEHKAPILEVELELKQGSVTELFELADELAREVPVWLSDVSKAERGYRLGLALPSLPEVQVALLSADQWVRKLYRSWLRRIEEFRAQPNQIRALWLVESVATLQTAIAGLADWSLGLTMREKLAQEFAEELRELEAVIEKMPGLTQEEVLAGFEGSCRAGLISLELSRWFADV